MPVSGNEETGVEPMVRKSSDYIAGVPIKKRRFPIIRPPSPPPEVPSVENDSLQKDSCSPSQGSALSNASVSTSSCLSDMNKNSESEVRRGSSDVVNDYVARGNVNYTKVKVEEPSISIRPGSLDDVNSKDKLLMAENAVRRVISVKKELSLASTESLALNIGSHVPTNQNTEVKNASEVSALPENSESLFQLKEHLPALAGHCSDSRFQNQGTSESISLNLSLSKESSNIKSKNDGDGSSNSTALLHANRANWDLNTTMDAWEGSANDAAVGKMSIDRIDTTGGTHDIKPLICSSGMIGVDVASEKHAENLRKLAITSSLLSKQYKSDDSLHLGLSPSCPQPSVGHESSASSFKLDSNRAVLNTSLSKVEVKTSTTNLNAINMRAVKPEPVDESVKLNQEGANATNVGLSNSRVGKGDQCHLEALKSPNILNKKLVDLRSIKSEPSFEGNKETIKLVEGMPPQVKRQVVMGVDNRICAGKSASSTELSKSGDLLNNSGQFSSTNAAQNDATISQEACGNSKQVVTSVDGKVDIIKPGDNMVEDPQSCKLKSTNELLDSHGNDEGSASDEEKVNISADMLEDNYDSDYESDGNHALNTAVDTKQDRVEDDYEDGEVREPLEHIPAEKSVCENGPAELTDKDDCGNKKIDSVGFSSDVDCNSSHVGEKDNKSLDTSETSNKDGEQATAMALDKPETESSRAVCLQESPTVEKQPGEAAMKGLIKVAQRKPRDLLGKKDVQKSQETGSQSNQVFSESERTVVIMSQGTETDVNRTDEVQMNDPALPKPSTSGDNTANNTSGAGQRSRIINLPSSIASSPCKTRSISGRLFPSRPGRDRVPDVALEGDKIHPRGRDEIYLDSTQKFSRERHQDQSPRNTRMNFQRGRGRITSRIDTFCGDRESDHDFNSEFYNGQTGFRGRHNKYASAVSGADLEYSPYNMVPDVPFVGTGRGGRKPLNDEGPIIHRMPSRRRSPGGGRGMHMVRRISRNISPSRCIGEDGTELVGLRHGEKFMRGFPDDSMDPIFTRPQPSYEGVDGHFGRGNRTFSSVQRRGLPRIRSKSPINSRTRSPGQWSSPRRRSPDGFGHPGLTHRRSPPFYRMERMRSPDRPCFPGEMVVRRNDMRDMDSGRDHGHPRPVIPNRSPSGRIILRNRRFDVIESQERPNGDDYFGGPLHSGRLHELAGDGNGDDRRRFGERRGPVRPYRPPFNDADGENFHLNPEDGPRPFRFCPDDDAEFQERGNLREREFDRRIKNRPGNAPRRMRSIEEQESNYRHGGQVWHDDGFDDLSRVKRKRF